jgi:hypothetical protein
MEGIEDFRCCDQSLSGIKKERGESRTDVRTNFLMDGDFYAGKMFQRDVI